MAVRAPGGLRGVGIVSIHFFPGRTKIRSVRVSAGEPRVAPSAFATFNPERSGSGMILSNGNLTLNGSTANRVWKTSIATVGFTPADGRKLYAEFKLTNSNNRIMLIKEPYDVETIAESGASFYAAAGWVKINNGPYLEKGVYGRGPTPDNSSWVSMWWDGAYVNWAVNGSRVPNDDPNGFSTEGVFGAKGVSITKVFPAVPFIQDSPDAQVVANFGASPWQYTPPAGYEGWSAPLSTGGEFPPPSTGGEMLPPAGSEG